MFWVDWSGPVKPAHGICKAAGISGAATHSLRPAELTSLAKRGIGVRALVALAEHSIMAATKRYIDLYTVLVKAAVELVLVEAFS